MNLKHKILTPSIFILAIGLIFAFAQVVANISEKRIPKQSIPDSTSRVTIPTFSGQDIWNAVNKYRVENNVKEVKLDDRYCTNLAQRWMDINKGLDEGTAHAKFEEWEHKYIPRGYYVAEDWASGNTVQEVMDTWIGSPGHRLSLLDPKIEIGCSYVNGHSAVIELGYKKY